MGFRQSSLAGISLSVDDVIIPERKQRIIALAEEVESFIVKAYSKGVLTPELAGMCNQRLKTNITFAEKNPRTGGLELVRPNLIERLAVALDKDIWSDFSKGKDIFSLIEKPSDSICLKVLPNSFDKCEPVTINCNSNSDDNLISSISHLIRPYSALEPEITQIFTVFILIKFQFLFFDQRIYTSHVS